MSDGGSIVNFVKAVHDGEQATVEVVVSGDSVEIGGWAFAREDLLFALAAKQGEAERFDLERFTTAQDAGAYDDALAELRAGRKTSHWMWFVFPQIAGLGRSSTAQRYAIESLEEAQAYLAHPTLGERLRQCARLLVDLGQHDARAILGSTDAMKLRSSMTLFARAAPDEPLFREVLDQYFDGAPDPETERRL